MRKFLAPPPTRALPFHRAATVDPQIFKQPLAHHIFSPEPSGESNAAFDAPSAAQAMSL